MDYVSILNILLDRLLFKTGFSLSVGLELEFYLHGAVGAVEDDFMRHCASLKIDKEKGLAQYEFSTPYSSADCAINTFFSYKEAVCKFAHQLGLIPDFSSKPLCSDYGSAAHYHISLHDGEKNIFSDHSIEDNKILRNAIDGILAISELSIPYFMEQEGMKRLVPGFMAPTHISWGKNNRTTMIRIPDSPLKNRRIEFRLPSPKSNPYKVLTALVVGILYGLDNRAKRIDCTYGNAYDAQYCLQPIIFSSTKLGLFDEILSHYLCS
ncbi:Glutamine synthetase domain protein [Candidatus Cyrtobacter comes]|uniref:Glutamine synthetase domain protein n=1 Tax=Candidatus Cyrtobacter comes TaxID=675776 RepID=A0ABU5L7F6_9RICK|nr:hypothetical protein [Candidatus Cyrtobacter comes]MDZ5761800.1 Glutamine synthetase domain protein [Candidatus Cyrtobacter comes]